jgi:hypothetical protein
MKQTMSEKNVGSKARFSFAVISSQEAQKFWHNAPDASAFTEPAILERLSQRVDWLLAAKGDVPVCLWPVCLPDGLSPAIPDFCYYIGPVWNTHGTQAPPHRWLADSTQVYEGLITLMLQRYGKVYAQMPLGMQDIRVFDWWNYHERQKSKFIIKPRYSACIRGVQSMSEEEIQCNFRNKRRQVLRNIIKHGAPQRSDFWKKTELVDLYLDVMKLQKKAVSKRCLENIHALCSLANEGKGEVIAFRNGQNEILSIGMLLYGKNVANLVLCLTSTRWRDEKINLWTMYSMIMAGKAKGMDIIDFNGANSPSRADDKHSYGARAELFFELQYSDSEEKSLCES